MSGAKTTAPSCTYLSARPRPPVAHPRDGREPLEDVPVVRRSLVLLASLALVAIAATPVAARNPDAVNVFHVTVLQSDATDASLVNGWGIVSGPTTPWWVSNEGTDTSTLYNGTTGAKVALTVGVAGGPTGVVFNGASTFPVTPGGTNFARFIFATLSGTVQAWTQGLASAVVEATARDDGSYTGLATGSVGTTPYLYAADFANGRVDVYDGTFTLQDWGSAFTDPGLPAGYAPFGIQELGGSVFVAYALRGDDGDEVAGDGLGVVSAFGTDGSFQGRVATGGALNAPWGLAWAPAGWGKFSNHLLVGNFGNGRVNAYRWTADGWEARGHLKTANHKPLVIDGLWGLSFGKGAANNGPASTLFFAAGPEDETEGQFGTITAGP
jgi:uncharacterized protein (TIGR03118 family)